MAEQKDEQSSAAVAPAKAKPKPKRSPLPGIRKLPPYNVVLLNDDDHTYAYVIEMLNDIFAHPLDRALGMAEEVDSKGRVIVLTTHKEHAELKCEQIHCYGADPRMEESRGSMSAIVEPAEEA